MNERRPSVIVRCKNKEATIGLTMKALRSQTVSAEIVVVDSGSTDRTLEIVEPFCDQLVTIPPAEFTYGRALNIGAAHATGDICFALSAHSVPTTEHWIEWSLDAYDDPTVAATTGALDGPDRRLLSTPTPFGAADLRLDTNPFWGLSNHASSWRRDVWISQPFDERVIACEDKEWMWRVLAGGDRIMADPRLFIDTQHRRADGLRALLRRQYRERVALAQLLAYEPIPATRAIAQWWADFPYPSERPRWQRRLSPWRTTELLGEYLGDHVGARRRGPDAISPEIGIRTI